MPTIRPLTNADFDRVLEINAANVPAVGPIDGAQLAFLVEESCVALVAEVGGPPAITVAGFCVVLPPGSSYESVNYRWFMDRFDTAWYLDRVALDAAFHGQGMGSELYAAVDREVSARRAAGAALDRLTLEVNVDPPNVASLAFHARLGFVEVGRQQTPYGTEVSLQEKRY